MIQEEFKVMDWLRQNRDKHSKKIKDWTPEQILQETKDNADKVKKSIEEIKKQKNN